MFFTWFLDEGGVATFRDHLGADRARYARFAARCWRRASGVIPAGRWYLSAAHDDADVDRALGAAERALAPRLDA